MKILTEKYCPFVMGGNVWQPITCNVEVDGPHDLGKGFKGYIATAPNGTTFIIEEKSGALVGPDLKTVREDIAQCDDISLMNKQVEDAIVKMKRAEEISPDEFWRLLKCL